MQPNEVPEPWHSFLRELDDAVLEETHLHCLGGFVITQLYGFKRSTSDVDVLSIAPIGQIDRLLRQGGKGSQLHKKYGIYLDYVTIASYPYNYDERLKEMFPDFYKNLRLKALDPYDLVLAKLGRNITRDREDVKYLAKTQKLDLELLRSRYLAEMRPDIVGRPRDYDLTLQQWIEMIQEEGRTGGNK